MGGEQDVERRDDRFWRTTSRKKLPSTGGVAGTRDAAMFDGQSVAADVRERQRPQELASVGMGVRAHSAGSYRHELSKPRAVAPV
jgi:hypothetical protein